LKREKQTVANGGKGPFKFRKGEYRRKIEGNMRKGKAKNSDDLTTSRHLERWNLWVGVSAIQSLLGCPTDYLKGFIKNTFAEETFSPMSKVQHRQNAAQPMP